jgi:hypothetical protein
MLGSDECDRVKVEMGWLRRRKEESEYLKGISDRDIRQGYQTGISDTDKDIII